MTWNENLVTKPIAMCGCGHQEMWHLAPWNGASCLVKSQKELCHCTRFSEASVMAYQYSEPATADVVAYSAEAQKAQKEAVMSSDIIARINSLVGFSELLARTPEADNPWSESLMETEIQLERLYEEFGFADEEVRESWFHYAQAILRKEVN